MKTKLEIVKAKKSKKQEEQADIKALVAEIKRFHEVINEKPELDLTELIKQLTALPDLVAVPIDKGLERFVNALDTHLTQTKQKQIDLSKLIKEIKIENKLDLKPIAREIAKLKEKAIKQSQSPEDFIPQRRVVKMGNKFFFDDNMTSSGGGGGGSIDTSTLAKESKQDDIVIAIGNISGATKYVTRIDEASATVTYIGKAVPDGATVPSSEASWQITKIDETSGTVITYADGDLLFDNIFDNRVGLTYA